ncbi:MAG TPA: hypothetical protein VFW96_16215 [Thermomicrobiales bacterium]|nr:hypothetical protein [Thermomicrobiales bacterium]
MAHVRSSFLVRWWRVRDGERFEVAHIQSGDKVLVASLADAAAWIGARAGAASDPPTADPAPPRDASGGAAPGDATARQEP